MQGDMAKGLGRGCKATLPARSEGAQKGPRGVTSVITRRLWVSKGSIPDMKTGGQIGQIMKVGVSESATVIVALGPEDLLAATIAALLTKVVISLDRDLSRYV